jgi:hypothetical protein
MANVFVKYGVEVANFYDFCRITGTWSALLDQRQAPSMNGPGTVVYNVEVALAQANNGRGNGGGSSGGGSGSSGGGGNPPGSKHGFIPPHKQSGFGNKNRSGFYKIRHGMPIKKKSFIMSPGMSRKNPG